MTYPIGTKGQPWQQAEKQQWLANQSIKRSYQEQVLDKINHITSDNLDTLLVEQYGSLSVDKERYPLFVIKTKNWQQDKTYLHCYRRCSRL